MRKYSGFHGFPHAVSDGASKAFPMFIPRPSLLFMSKAAWRDWPKILPGITRMANNKTKRFIGNELQVKITNIQASCKTAEKNLYGISSLQPVTARDRTLNNFKKRMAKRLNLPNFARLTHNRIMKENAIQEFRRLLEIMDELREKCPWDREQTLESLRKLTIEETYELADAILRHDLQEISKELGDLMLHIVFYAKIGMEKDAFNMADVLENINRKLIYRHPHVFGDVSVAGAREVEENWEALKLKEKDRSSRVLEGVPAAMPALVKANRIQEKASGVGFDWEYKEQVWDKVKEEISELSTEIDRIDTDKMEAEFGDLFFAMVNAARLYGVDPEAALERTNLKFIRRFNYLESQTMGKGKSLRDMTLAEMDEIWNEAKELPGE